MEGVGEDGGFRGEFLSACFPFVGGIGNSEVKVIWDFVVSCALDIES